MIEPDRGVNYADGGIATGNVHYPDPTRIAAIHAEWEGRYVPYDDVTPSILRHPSQRKPT